MGIPSQMTIVQFLASTFLRGRSQTLGRSFLLLPALMATGLLGLAGNGFAQQGALPRYVKAVQGAKVRNFQDLQGLAFHTLAGGELLQVHSQSRGAVRFYEVSAPAGFPVWVFGKYLQETGAEDVMRVTGSHINMRPRPDSSAASMPLRARLMTGDKVAYVSRRDPALALTQDWVKIWSPESARAWVRVEDTEPVDSPTAAAAEYASRKRVLKNKPLASKGGGVVAASVPKPRIPEVSEAAIAALKAADAEFEQVTQAGPATPAQLGQIEAAYGKVLSLAPSGSHTYKLAQQQLERVTIQRSLADLRAEMAAAKEANTKRLDELVLENSRAELKKTTSWGRFHARGWLEREEPTKDEPRFYLRWDGERKAEVVCGQGRYDLESYVGFQLGVQGHTRRPAQPASLNGPAEPQVLDIYKLEVVAGSSKGR